MKVLKLIKQFFGPRFRDAVSDPRPKKEQEKDYIYGLDVALTPTKPNKKRITKTPFDVQNQQQAGSCGAFSAAHARKNLEGERVEPLFWYRGRTNYPYIGMFLKDVIKMAAHATGYPMIEPKPHVVTEQYAHNIPPKALFANNRKEDYEYVKIKPYDARAVVDAVSTGHGVVVGFYSTLSEWDFEMYERETTTIMTAPVRHFVVAIPNSYHVKDGHEWISVVDSSPYKGHYLRHIRIDFLAKRMYLGGAFYYKLSPSKKKKGIKLPEGRCQYGQRNESVLDLQKFLVNERLMIPRHTTGYYGNITSNAVLSWQLNNVFDVPHNDLMRWGGRYWGPASIRQIKKRK